MPTMASLTVKKQDGTTDIVYDGLAGSGGDQSAAVWRQDTGQAATFPVGLRPFFTLQTVWNGPKTARQARFEYVYPYAYQETATSPWVSKDRAVFTATFTLPQAIPESVLREAAFQGPNLFDALLIRQALQAGYAPT